jgi:hypothetical protein
MRKHKRLLLSVIMVVITAAPIGYVAQLYWRGGKSNYEPPKQTYASPQEKVQSDLQNLAQAVEAYFVKNMEYPRKLELLQPEFLDRVASDPLSGKPYLYTFNETAAAGRYRISVPEPGLYKTKDFYIEDGRLVQK